MDPTITAAVIGAGATVGAALIGRKWGKQKGAKDEKAAADTRAQKGAQTLQAQLGERFGFKASKIVSQLVVLDANGNAHGYRRWRGVEVKKGNTVAHIAGEFHVQAPTGRISTSPRLSGVRWFPKEVSLVETARSDTFTRYRVDIAGSLSYGDPPLDFDLDVGYEGAILMSMADVEKAYIHDVLKRDYLGFDVVMPIDEIELEVEFPVGKRVTAFPSVCYGWSEHPHDEELKRAKAGFERTPNGGRFAIKEPLLGFRYLIYWVFPES